MKTLWNIISRVLFWDYERGSVPYDLMVIAVVAFVFLTPRAWFKDRPFVTLSELHAGQLQMLEEDAATQSRTYRIDARLLGPAGSDLQLESMAHSVLEKNVEDLRTKKFSIVRTQRQVAPDGTVLYYDVVIR